MAGRSSLEFLPPETLAVVNEAIREGATIDEIVKRMRAHGGTCSRSAVTRYAKQAREAFGRHREAEGLADLVLDTPGDRPEGRTRRLALETLGTLAMRAASALDKGKEPPDIEKIGALALAMRRIESAGKSGAERESAAARNAARKAAERTGPMTLPRKGLSPQAVAHIRAAVEGPQSYWETGTPRAHEE